MTSTSYWRDLQERAPSLDTPDYLGALAEGLRSTWPAFAQELNALSAQWRALAGRSALTALETEQMALAWDKVTQALRSELNAVQLKTANEMILARAQAVDDLLATVDFRAMSRQVLNA